MPRTVALPPLPTAYANQVKVEAALRALQGARDDLEPAFHNHGEFRVKAIEALDQAIVAVREGAALASAPPPAARIAVAFVPQAQLDAQKAAADETRQRAESEKKEAAAAAEADRLSGEKARAGALEDRKNAERSAGRVDRKIFGIAVGEPLSLPDCPTNRDLIQSACKTSIRDGSMCEIVFARGALPGWVGGLGWRLGIECAGATNPEPPRSGWHVYGGSTEEGRSPPSFLISTWR